MCSTQLCNPLRITQHAGDARNSLKVIRARVLGRQQQEHDVNRLVIKRFEIDGRLQLSENTSNTFDAVDLAVWNCNAITDAS